MCGASRHEDIEGLETWNYISNPIDFLANLEIPIDFDNKPENKINIHFDKFSSITISSEDPFFYFVKRGSNLGNIDRMLQNYALSIGCEIRFGFTPKKKNINIIASGSNNAKAFIQGITFNTKLNDQTHLLLNSSLTKTGYGYLIIWNGKATLAVAYKKLESNQILKKLELICKKN